MLSNYNFIMQTEEELKEDEEIVAPVIDQPFQSLSLTCPDGLSIKYALESSLGTSIKFKRSHLKTQIVRHYTTTISVCKTMKLQNPHYFVFKI